MIRNKVLGYGIGIFLNFNCRFQSPADYTIDAPCFSLRSNIFYFLSFDLRKPTILFCLFLICQVRWNCCDLFDCRGVFVEILDVVYLIYMSETS